ncbi:MAG: AAA family ATPase [Deltaproteobacteria bacterium]|nr:AAA family ATPase [Deltaproteobacteria bacterium]
MLTRLKVSGFKNLVDVDVRFGPFTCVAGPNGVGKSNLFDAIRFLSALADRPLVDAALSVRDEGGRTADIRSLFHRVGDVYANEMSFAAEMIVPQEARDDLGQKAKASITFLRYSLTLAYRKDESRLSLGSLEIVKEELVHINLGEASRHLLFPHSATQWRKSAVHGQRRGAPFISTEGEGENRVIKLHQDGGSAGRPLARPAVNLPRTVLSAANAAESPTVLVARREMQSWHLLQLEPSALRQPDEFSAPAHLGVDGSHLAATLYRLARSQPTQKINGEAQDGAAGRVYSQVANRLAELIADVHELWIERDERRELLTLQVKDRDHTSHPARALSDGTLRFMALAVLQLDPETQGLLCLEEPENGIHPERIPAMLELLKDIATDVNEPVNSDNPLRQVIVNTHSPAVVSQVDDGSLLVAELKESARSGQRFKRVCFSCLSDTWRVKGPENVTIVSKGKLLAYLNPVAPEPQEPDLDGGGKVKHPTSRTRRVVDRPDLQLLLPLAEQAG